MDIWEKLLDLAYGEMSEEAVAMREAAWEIERLRAELAARDGEIAGWLREQAEIFEPFGINRIKGPWPFLETAADEIERGAYRKQKTV